MDQSEGGVSGVQPFDASADLAVLQLEGHAEWPWLVLRVADAYYEVVRWQHGPALTFLKTKEF